MSKQGFRNFIGWHETKEAQLLRRLYGAADRMAQPTDAEIDAMMREGWRELSKAEAYARDEAAEGLHRQTNPNDPTLD